ncbi:MAG: hypothetical protein HXX16_06805 [Bacteroidales bacterium]|nr:hypothetical protein [Bacteroidales bacterium]
MTENINAQNISCKYEDSGVFIGLVTVPPKTNTKEFCKDESLFYGDSKTKYFRHREKFQEYGKNFSEDFYKVKAYNLFGDFDLALITLIDDLEFGNSAFHPSYQNKNNPDLPDNYYYQVLTGICPSYLYGGLESKFKEMFLKKKESLLPLIAISKFKVNDGLLIGNGLKLIIEINNFIQNLVIKKKESLDCILLETFCNNEICVVFLSNSFKKITDIVLSIRESSLKQLDNHSDIAINSLLFNLSKGVNDEHKLKNIYYSHLFTNTQTIFGYDLDFSDGKNFIPIDDNFEKDVQMFNQWEIKPGHMKHLIKLIKKRNEFLFYNSSNTTDKASENALITNGRADLTTKYKYRSDKLPSINDLSEFDSHFNRFRTFINVKKNDGKLPGTRVSKEHLHITELLSIFRFDEALVKLEKNLIDYGISNVIRNRILRIFRNYNDGIQDPLLFASFIELHGYLKNILETIKNEVKKKDRNIVDFHGRLKILVDTFDKAYNNRYHQSYRMLNSTDFNLEFNGGIQQLISLYDTAYKVVLSGLGEKTPTSVIEVSDSEGVVSDKFCLRLNYLHVFLPELFATLIVKEAANYYPYRVEDEWSSNNFDIYLKKGIKGHAARLNIRNKIDLSDSIINLILSKRNEDFFSTEEFLISILDYNHFRYFFVDRVYFHLGFKGNKELFFRWLFFNYIQQTKYYSKKEKKYSRINLIKQLVRLIVLFYEDDKDFINFMKITPPSNIFLKSWLEDFVLALELVKALFKIKNFETFYDSVRLKAKLVTLEVINKGLPPDSDIEKTVQDILQKAPGLLGKVVDRSDKSRKDSSKKRFKLEGKLDSVIEMIDRITFNVDSYRSILKEGISIQDFPKQPYDVFIINLCYSFVFLYNESILGKEFCSLYYRKESRKNASNTISPILADPLGGIFIPSHEKRKEIFKCRVVFLKTLWHFNYKFKSDVFLQVKMDKKNKAIKN